jgi:anti-anti-sigma factor
MTRSPDDRWQRPRPGLVVVPLPEELDVGNSARTGAELAEAAVQGTIVVADMSATRFCDSSAVAALIRADRALAAAGAQLRLVLTSPAVARILAVTGAADVLSVFPSLEQATSREDD